MMWLVQVLGGHPLSQKERMDLGKKYLLESSVKRLQGDASTYLDGIPNRYKLFRSFRQRDEKWYGPGKIGDNIHPIEVDLLLSAMFFAARKIDELRVTPKDQKILDTPALSKCKELVRNQVLVDEATDFSPLQLYCMNLVTNPVTKSFFACGDFNQRITSWGTQSLEQMRWAVPKIETKTVSHSYRQSANLHAFASSLLSAESSSSQSIMELDGTSCIPENEVCQGVNPAVAEGLSDPASISGWVSDRICEIEASLGVLPTIAILVNTEDQVKLIADALAKDLQKVNIPVAACPNGRVRGSECEVRVFNIEHIKGLEFEAVFFIGVDQLAAVKRELFEKFLYVGATRAATFLGMTCEVELPSTLQKLGVGFVNNW